MEINRFKTVKGVIPTADVAAGRVVALTSHSFNSDFGSLVDLPGAAVPATADAAKAAKYVIDFEPTNQTGPFYKPMPSLGLFAERNGFSVSENTTFNAQVSISYPGWHEGKTIPSGVPALAYTNGTFTFVSGEYIYNAALRNAGAFVIAANTAEDSTNAGKIKYQATFDDRVIGVVRRYDTATGNLVVDIDMH